jgi:preprotein translocase subunit SecF
MNIVAHRKLFYIISLLLIVPGLVSLIFFGLRLGIDFTGGSVLTAQGTVTVSQAATAASGLGLKDLTVISTGSHQTEIKYHDDASTTIQGQHHTELSANLKKIGVTEASFYTIDGTISHDITVNAIGSLLAASIVIVLYIAFAFRNMPPPVSSWAFGGAAIIALLHDAFLVLGVFSILGKVFKVEIDAQFITAILTVIGFSVHDTIVVFDRIRENLRRQKGTFDEVVNASIQETMARSLNTSLTVILTLLALFLFGGQSIRLFVLALIIGIASGTYSSICNASQLLVSYQQYKLKHPKK